MTPSAIALFVDRPDWHSVHLTEAFAARGVEAHSVPMRDGGFQIGAGPGPLLPGFEEALPLAVLVRCVPGGSFEQVTLRLSQLHALRELGVPGYNDARAIERCVDKATTSFFLQHAGLPTPETWAFESAETAARLVEREASAERPLVLKPLFGSQGRGLELILDPDDLPPSEEVAGVYYLQRYIAGAEPGWRDVRVFVTGGRAVAAMTRHGRGWITNAKQGATCEALALDEGRAGLAVAAAGAVGAFYAGVDILRAADGRDFVLEVNSMPAWSALQRISETDIAQELADALLADLARRGPAPTLSAVAE